MFILELREFQQEEVGDYIIYDDAEELTEAIVSLSEVSELRFRTSTGATYNSARCFCEYVENSADEENFFIGSVLCETCKLNIYYSSLVNVSCQVFVDRVIN